MLYPEKVKLMFKKMLTKKIEKGTWEERCWVNKGAKEFLIPRDRNQYAEERPC